MNKFLKNYSNVSIQNGVIKGKSMKRLKTYNSLMNECPYATKEKWWN